ncbi:hypothetical protein D3C81_1073550 [compost metagenome]
MGELVEFWNASPNPIHDDALLEAIQALLQHLNVLGHDVADHLALAVVTGRIQPKHDGLSKGNLVLDTSLLMRHFVDAFCSSRQLTADGALTDDLCVVLGVGHAWRVGLYLSCVGQCPGAAGQFCTTITEGDHINRVAVSVQLQDQAVQIGVVIPRESIGSQFIGDDVDQVWLTQHGAQYAVLGLKAVKFDHWAASEISRNTARLTRASSRGWTFWPRKNTWLRLLAFWKKPSQKPCPLW